MADSFSTQAPAMAMTLTFVLVMLVSLALKFWLASRQIRHVAQHRHGVPANFSDTITMSAHQRAADYTVAKARFGMIELAIGSTLVLAWTLLGGLAALNQLLFGWLGGGMWQQLALLTAFVLIGATFDLPLALYQTFVIEERFGFNKMSLRLWLLDLLKSCVLGAVIGLPIAGLILWMMATTGTGWWLWAWSVWMGFNLLLLMIYPSFIAPLFNKFAPLQDETLAERVTALMKRCGFAAKGLYVMDGSKRSAHANAYFTGFGRAKRVVFYDTLVARLSAAELDAVLAHELGHFKHKHIIKRIIMLFVGSLLGFALLGWLASQTWFYAGLGVQPNLDQANDALALLLFMLTAPVFSFFGTPLLAHFSRRHEFQADAYAACQTSGHDLCTALLKLYQDNASTLTPDPMYVKFYYSHPPASERVARLMG